MTDAIHIKYGCEHQKPVVVMEFTELSDGAVLSPDEARTLAKHLTAAAFNAELASRNQRKANGR